MDKEAKPVTDRMTHVKEKQISGKRVIFGTLFKKKTAVVICGVGKVNAACGAQLAIDLLKADKIINIGVAGGLNDSVEVGKMYCISAAVQYDFDLTQLNGTQIGTLDERTENYIPLAICGKYPQRLLATGDRFNDSLADYKLLKDVLKADIRDMEGGAIAEVCKYAGIPFISVKSISDVYGSGSTTDQFRKNLKLAILNIQAHMKEIIEAIDE